MKIIKILVPVLIYFLYSTAYADISTANATATATATNSSLKDTKDDVNEKDRDIHFSLSGYYVAPVDARLSDGQALAIQLASAVGFFQVGVEYFTDINTPHSYTYSVPYGKLEEQREYDTHSGRIFVRISPWHMGYLTPYFGGYFGATVVYDTSDNSEVFDEKVSNDKYIVGGPVAGLELLPNAAISIFVEARQSFQLKGSVQRQKVVFVNQFGQQETKTDIIKLDALYIGAGLRFNFY